MRDPSFYSHRPPSVEVEETHISIVFLAGERVYKVKKELTLPFLDYGTLERRRLRCEDEVRLNRRLAPDTYLGVRSIVASNGSFSLGAPGDRSAVEYAVEMRRLPTEATLERLIGTGKADEHTVERVARRVAEFHREAAPAPPGRGDAADVKAQIDENFTTVLPWAGSLVDAGTFAAVERFANAFVLANRELFDERAERGRVRDGHGDLRAEHVLLEGDQVTVYDCVEFDEGLRRVDVASDLAFLYMDLERLGAGGLAAALVRAYAEASGDSEVADLIPFYACYRAWVRAKTGCLRIAQLDPDTREGDALVSETPALFALARRLAWRARLPLALVFCGVAASGKSAVAAALAALTGFAHLNSDEIRKTLAGVPVNERAPKEIYEGRFSTRTYEELAARARAELEAGRGAIIDATLLFRSHRQRLRESLQPSGAHVLFCECRAPMPLLRERAQARERAPERGSDATWDVVQTQMKRLQPLYDVPARDHLVVRTDRPVADAVDEVEAFASRAVEGLPLARPTSMREDAGSDR